jgi:type IV secretion system protein VirB4
VWLGELIKEESEMHLPSDIEAMVAGAIDYAYDSLLTEHRQLSTVTQFFPMDFPRWDRLKKWLKSSSGDYAFLFDNATDSLVLDTQKIGFDMTWLMNQPRAVLTAVCLYLVHQIECSLDGRLVGIYFDEGWQILNNPYWKSYLEKTLPTLRKLNAYIVLSTQSPQSVIESSLSAQFLDNCATTIFFCNEKADFDKHYRHFNITESEFQFIKETPRSQRLFLYKQGHESAIATLNLSGLDDALAVYSANQKSLQLLDKIRAEVGDDPAAWLPVFHERRKLHD